MRSWHRTLRRCAANAGHIAGVLLQPSGTVDGLLSSTGLPLGLFPEATFPVRGLQFRTQQILVLATDGAAATTDANEKEFGSDGVTEYVRTHANETAQQLANGVYGAARAFGALEPQVDDITSVIVKVTDAALCTEQAALPLDGSSVPDSDRERGMS